MGRSIGIPDLVPNGKVSDSQSGSIIQAEWRKGKLIHRLSEDGIAAEYEIRYQIGAGKIGRSYAVLAGDFLLESPASYYKRYGWDISPGYSGSELLDFNRVLTGRCLFCHSNYLSSYREGRLHVEDLVAIGCERCHGETSGHLSRPSAATIVNPAKLPARARDSICEQCHLEGVARVLNPGKSLSDFKPGMNLETTMVIYVAKQGGPEVRAVSQEQQLALSRCALESQGKLWCGSCHNPHAQVKNRDAEIKAVCTSCHAARLPDSHSNFSECVSCHMGRRSPADVAHAALTDHRIVAKAEATSLLALSAPDELRAWREPAPDLQQRDLGLAYLAASANAALQKFGDLGGSLLKSLPSRQQRSDAAVMAALGGVSLSRGSFASAQEFFSRARELDPTSGEYAMYLGIVLRQSGDSAAAHELAQAIELDHSLQRAYLELSTLYAKAGKYSEAKAVLSQYLAWNPQSILVRLTRKALAPAKEKN